MTIAPSALSSLAMTYTKSMTSIRGRRVHRLLMREFAGADQVLLVEVDAGAAFLGLSASGAALCATDGRGRQATIAKWRHGAGEAQETHFDLHKDSLPQLGHRTVPMEALRARGPLRLPSNAPAVADDALVARVLRDLAR